jgi:hypothetical protein
VRRRVPDTATEENPAGRFAVEGPGRHLDGYRNCSWSYIISYARPAQGKRRTRQRIRMEACRTHPQICLTIPSSYR